MYVCVYIYIYRERERYPHHICIYVYIHILYIYMYMCVYIYIYIYMYIHSIHGLHGLGADGDSYSRGVRRRARQRHPGRGGTHICYVCVMYMYVCIYIYIYIYVYNYCLFIGHLPSAKRGVNKQLMKQQSPSRDINNKGNDSAKPGVVETRCSRLRCLQFVLNFQNLTCPSSTIIIIIVISITNSSSSSSSITAPPIHCTTPSAEYPE